MIWKIPFEWLPASWGLRGNSRLLAKAEYELTGYDLEIRKVEINWSHDPQQMEIEKLQIQLNHGKITAYEFDVAKAKVLHPTDSQELKLALLDAELAHKKIELSIYEKQRASICKEPWVSIPKIHWDPIHNGKTYFELDYNEYFIDYLKDNGYSGTEDDILNKWLNDICSSITQEMLATFVQNNDQKT